MAGETADFAASHVPSPINGADTGLHVAVGAVWSGVEKLVARPTASVTMTDDDRTAIAADVVSQLAPQFKIMSQLADRLGMAGNALSALNDNAGK